MVKDTPCISNNYLAHCALKSVRVNKPLQTGLLFYILTELIAHRSMISIWSYFTSQLQESHWPSNPDWFCKPHITWHNILALGYATKCSWININFLYLLSAATLKECKSENTGIEFFTHHFTAFYKIQFLKSWDTNFSVWQMLHENGISFICKTL